MDRLSADAGPLKHAALAGTPTTGRYRTKAAYQPFLAGIYIT
jgi:hypothetical protein